VDANSHIEKVSTPSIAVYLPPKASSTGVALIICPGGGYRALDWKTHVEYAAQYFLPRGIAVIGLKYRLNPPNPILRDDRSVPILDVERAVRTVRSHAAEWNIDPHKIGVVGYSAGANLTMTLLCNFDAGDPSSPDPIERQSSRPDFAVGCATWHWREKESPFTFPKDSPPVFLVHATNDGVPGGAPIELPKAIQKQLEGLGVPVHLEIYDEGAHGVANLIPQRVKAGFPGSKWPEALMEWLSGLDQKYKPLN